MFGGSGSGGLLGGMLNMFGGKEDGPDHRQIRRQQTGQRLQELMAQQGMGMAFTAPPPDHAGMQQEQPSPFTGTSVYGEAAPHGTPHMGAESTYQGGMMNPWMQRFYEIWGR